MTQMERIKRKEETEAENLALLSVEFIRLIDSKWKKRKLSHYFCTNCTKQKKTSRYVSLNEQNLKDKREGRGKRQSRGKEHQQEQVMNRRSISEKADIAFLSIGWKRETSLLWWHESTKMTWTHSSKRRDRSNSSSVVVTGEAGQIPIARKAYRLPRIPPFHSEVPILPFLALDKELVVGGSGVEELQGEKQLFPSLSISPLLLQCRIK